ncbi:PAP2 family protein, partial [Francisella tularensis subsp. holarctica]|nr:PAP2 family protein [Francisella tularensis subsp. holarctica]
MAIFHIILGLIVCFFAWIFFLIFPNLDIKFAGHFYNSSSNQFIGWYDCFLVFL